MQSNVHNYLQPFKCNHQACRLIFCCKNALSSDELQQLLDVIGASDEELGLKSAWTAAITKIRGKTAWDWLNEMKKK